MIDTGLTIGCEYKNDLYVGKTATYTDNFILIRKVSELVVMGVFETPGRCLVR